jgi:branched-chain amino acid aminotransferase
MATYCYFDGKIVPLSKALLPVTDISILRGYAIFDFTKVYQGKLFLLHEHIQRFKNSAKKMNLKTPVSDTKIKKIISALLAKNKMRDANVRFVLTGGKTIDGLSYDAKNSLFFILLEPVKNLPLKLYTHGAKLMTYEFQRSFPDVKTTMYITAVKLQAEKRKRGAVEILYIYKGKILEATTSNFFIFRGNKLITSKNNILIGITRNFVIQLARKAGFTVIERDIRLHELQEAHEAFITATNKEILPITKVDNQKIGSGIVGKHTKQLMNMFQERINNL